MVFTNHVRSQVFVKNYYANGKQNFSTEAWHFQDSLGFTTSIPAGTGWCSNTAPVSEIHGIVSYSLGGLYPWATVSYSET
jgi:hypothetical protein